MDRIRRYMHIVEIAMRDHLDPEDIVNYGDLVDFAAAFAASGIPPHPMRAHLGQSRDPATPPYTPSQVIRAIMSSTSSPKTYRCGLNPVRDAMHLLLMTKHLPEQEQDRALVRLEQGHRMWYFHRLNVDVHDLARAIHGLAPLPRYSPDEDDTGDS